jgi:hypothetical protein
MPLMAVVWFLVTTTSVQELLDRTLALVGGQPITLSDTRAAVALGLITPAAADPNGDVVAQLITRELVLREVQRYAPAPPPESAVDARLAEIRRRFNSAAALTAVLEAHAFSDTRLRAWLRDDLRTEAYLAQRFASATMPGDQEIAAAYTRDQAAFDAQNLTFEQAAPVVRDRLIAARRRELIADWVLDLRRRTPVVILQQ